MHFYKIKTLIFTFTQIHIKKQIKMHKYSFVFKFYKQIQKNNLFPILPFLLYEKR